jgi:RHS repeat-associated protein
VEQVATSGSTTTTTASYYAGGTRIAEAVNGTVSYLGTDSLGSATVALDSTGATQAAQLFAPYGSVRYSSGTLPTDDGFTGQHSDAVTGLDYYVARSYDPVAGQFTSADTVLPGNGYDPLGLSRYAYVQGNPETHVDADGHGFGRCARCSSGR